MKWLVPWYSLDDPSQEREGMERELARELTQGHELFGLPVRALARRQDCDDVLFALEGSERVAVVHLTWSPNEKAPWPSTELFASLDEFVVVRMQLDHDRFHYG